MTSVPWLVIWIGSFDEDQKVALDRRSYLAERKYIIVNQDFPCELVNCVDNIKDGTKIAYLQSKLKRDFFVLCIIYLTSMVCWPRPKAKQDTISELLSIERIYCYWFCQTNTHFLLCQKHTLSQPVWFQ